MAKENSSTLYLNEITSTLFHRFHFHQTVNFLSRLSCAESNLNGIYRDEPTGEDSRNYKGIFWEHWHGDYSLKASKMMIRPKADGFVEPPDEDLIDFNNATNEQ